MNHNGVNTFQTSHIPSKNISMLEDSSPLEYYTVSIGKFLSNFGELNTLHFQGQA
jgi:hypothetical protein